LIGNPDAEVVALQIVKDGLSVRAVEDMMRKKTADVAGASAAPRRSFSEKDADTKALEADLAAGMKMAVSIEHAAGGGGMVTITYKTLDDLDRLCALLSKAEFSDALAR
jgi:ParB family chromosome partitioning protein